MNITKIAKFLIAKSNYFDSATIMFDAPDELKKKVCGIVNSIPKNILNLDEGGVEDQAHITVIYGVGDTLDVRKYFTKPLIIESDNKITYFDNDKFTVAKIDIKSVDLNKLHYLIKNNEKNEHKYDYHPHITIAYLKKNKRLDEKITIQPLKWIQKNVYLSRNGLIDKVIL